MESYNMFSLSFSVGCGDAWLLSPARSWNSSTLCVSRVCSFLLRVRRLCTEVPHFDSPLSCWWLFGLFSQFGPLWTKGLWIFVEKSLHRHKYARVVWLGHKVVSKKHTLSHCHSPASPVQQFPVALGINPKSSRGSARQHPRSCCFPGSPILLTPATLASITSLKHSKLVLTLEP